MQACKKGQCEHLFHVETDEDFEELAQLKGNALSIKGKRNYYFCKATKRCKELGADYRWAAYQTPS